LVFKDLLVLELQPIKPLPSLAREIIEGGGKRSCRSRGGAFSLWRRRRRWKSWVRILVWSGLWVTDPFIDWFWCGCQLVSLLIEPTIIFQNLPKVFGSCKGFIWLDFIAKGMKVNPLVSDEMMNYVTIWESGHGMMEASLYVRYDDIGYVELAIG
jgi:hypothetical protein